MADVIQTNVCDADITHDLLAYPPIEKQVFDFLKTHFPSLAYQREGGIILTVDDSRISLEVVTKRKGQGVRLSLLPPAYGSDGIRFGSYNDKYPSVKLPYNKDLTKKIADFCDKVRKVQDLEKRAKALNRKVNSDTIRRFMADELAGRDLEVSCWYDNLFDGIEITFYLHPKHQAPADGLMFCFEKGTNKIVPFRGQGDESLQRVFGRQEKKDLASMKKLIESVESLQERLDAFNPALCPELMKLFELKRQADVLIGEFNGL